MNPQNILIRSFVLLKCFFLTFTLQAQQDSITDFDAFYKYQEIHPKAITSYYAKKFEGRKTASGEIFRNKQLTAAHKTLPFGTLLRVHSKDNQQSVLVRVNDRGPFVKGRELDLSQAAFVALAKSTKQGVMSVKIELAIPISEQELLDLIFDPSDF